MQKITALKIFLYARVLGNALIEYMEDCLGRQKVIWRITMPNYLLTGNAKACKHETVGWRVVLLNYELYAQRT
jgi:hypothetical protein